MFPTLTGSQCSDFMCVIILVDLGMRYVIDLIHTDNCGSVHNVITDNCSHCGSVHNVTTDSCSYCVPVNTVLHADNCVHIVNQYMVCDAHSQLCYHCG